MSGFKGERLIGHRAGTHRRIRVFHRGIEVTDRCAWVDALSATALLYVRSPNGHFVVDGDTVRAEIVHPVALRERLAPPPLAS